MLHALLLSPDDQAVSAISGVLEEMSVTCERPLDGVSAAQKLNSQSFDLVLVDCENLPAAKLIFDVCRRGKSGTNPVPIAIVDGRAGLPTAFRLGAELILTKPVAKDQARSTIRTAIGRVKKEVTPTEIADDAESAIGAQPEERAMAAAASASPQLTSFADVNPGFARGTVPPSYLTAALSASGLGTTMHPTADAVEAKPSTARPNLQFSASAASSPEYSSAEVDSASVKTARPLDPGDDLVLAELNRTELETAEASGPEPESIDGKKAAAKKPSGKSSAKPTGSYMNGRHKSRGPLVAVLMLMLAVAVFYAAWKYQPGFREVAQPRIYRLLNLAGQALPSTQMPATRKPSAQVSSAKTPAPAASQPAPMLATQPIPAPAVAATPVPTNVAQPAPTNAAAVTPSISATPSTTAPAASKPEVVKTVDIKPAETKRSESKKEQVAANPASAATSRALAPAASASATQLPGEKDAIILSSKGAEKRLAHSVPPKYPADAGSQSVQGKIVLRTVVNENGQVEGVRLVDGNVILATAAMQAVRQWRYRPYVRDGKALPFQTVVILDSH